MDNKKYVIGIILGVIVIGLIYIIGNKNNIITRDSHVARMCYFYKEKNSETGLNDRAWLTYVKINDTTEGLYYNLPAEKDSKFGPFSGVLINNNTSISGTWSASAEGMENKEQVLIDVNSETAQVLFGEMVLGQDGGYYYKDINQLFPSFQMSKINCDDLDDQIMVENYIRANISNLTTKKPVLGGNWYVTSVDINVSEKEVLVQFEDGHIQEKEAWKYQRNGSDVNIMQ